VVLASQRFILVLVPTISYLMQIGTGNMVCALRPMSLCLVRSQLEVTRVSVTTWAGIELILGTKVISVDVRRKTLDTSAGETISYERLIVATGARVCPHPIFACPCYFFFFPTYSVRFLTGRPDARACYFVLLKP
jgi:NADPH-dependent 2,4-dienoyl-CoA reductase/sulfur reductase-like enzyme